MRGGADGRSVPGSIGIDGGGGCGELGGLVDRRWWDRRLRLLAIFRGRRGIVHSIHQFRHFAAVDAWGSGCAIAYRQGREQGIGGKRALGGAFVGVNRADAVARGERREIGGHGGWTRRGGW